MAHWAWQVALQCAPMFPKQQKALLVNGRVPQHIMAVSAVVFPFFGTTRASETLQFYT